MGTRPLTGWRGEWTDGKKLWNFPQDTTAQARPCSRTPKPLWGVPQLGDTHEAPHLGCECGMRVVENLEVLDDYWEKYLHITQDIKGLNTEWPLDSNGVVICKVETIGTAVRAIPRHGDPLRTVRAGTLQLQEMYVPRFIDPAALQAKYPDVPVRELEALPDDLFTRLKKPKPEPKLSLAVEENAVRITLGCGEATIPREYVQGPEVFDAVWDVIRPPTPVANSSNPYLDVIREALVVPFVKPLPEDQQHRNACAQGIAMMLGIESMRGT